VGWRTICEVEGSPGFFGFEMVEVQGGRIDAGEKKTALLRFWAPELHQRVFPPGATLRIFEGSSEVAVAKVLKVVM
jgi:hypothetical protein